MLKYFIYVCLPHRLTYAMMGERGVGADEARVRKEEEESDGGWGVLLIVSPTRVVSRTDLHTRPQGTLGSVRLSLEPKKVGRLSATHIQFLSSFSICSLIPVLLGLLLFLETFLP